MLRNLLGAALLAGVFISTQAVAAVKSEKIEYRHGDTQLTGYLYYDDAQQGARPGIMVVHEWWGLNDYVRKRAEMLAELGYVAFAADMYGTGKATEHAAEAKGWMQQITANQAEWQARAMSGLEQLKKNPLVDPAKTAAIGYCFGGSTVMQMVYAGADLKGVASFHGSLPPPSEEQGKNIRSRIFIAHGAADAMVPPERVQQFQTALDQAGADWQFVSYGGAKHGFTNPGADKLGMDALAYDESADKRSWAQMQLFLKEIF
ncbi:MAG: dienelactone hydrolase family protein [Thiotrichales bacterium]